MRVGLAILMIVVMGGMEVARAEQPVAAEARPAQVEQEPTQPTQTEQVSPTQAPTPPTEQVPPTQAPTPPTQQVPPTQAPPTPTQTEQAPPPAPTQPAPTQPQWIPPGQVAPPPQGYPPQAYPPPGYGPPPPVHPYAPVEPEVETRKRWYGWQILLADAAALALGNLGDAGSATAALIFIVDAPVIHGIHGNGQRALLSVAGRVGIPLIMILGAMMVLADNCWEGDESFCGDDADDDEGLAIAILIGGTAAWIAFYAWDIATAYETTFVRRAPPNWRVGGMITPDGGSLGVMGRF